MRYRPGAHRSFRPRHRHWLRWLVLAVLVLAVLFLLYGCAVQRLIYSSRGTMIFLPERPLLRTAKEGRLPSSLWGGSHQ